MQHPSQQASRKGKTAGLSALRAIPLILVILLAISYLIAIPAGFIGARQRLGTPEIVLAAVLLVTLAFAAQTEYAVTDLTLGSGGVSAHFKKIEAGLNELEAEVRAPASVPYRTRN
jgi:choline-glycine betaine transporter